MNMNMKCIAMLVTVAVQCNVSWCPSQCYNAVLQCSVSWCPSQNSKKCWIRTLLPLLRHLNTAYHHLLHDNDGNHGNEYCLSSSSWRSWLKTVRGMRGYQAKPYLGYLRDILESSWSFLFALFQHIREQGGWQIENFVWMMVGRMIHYIANVLSPSMIQQFTLWGLQSSSSRCIIGRDTVWCT